MRRLAPLAALLAAAPLAACTIDRAVGPGVSVSPKLAQDCRDQCALLEMRLAAVVVISNAGGCVCEPEPASPAPPRASGASGAAAAGLALAQARARTESQQQTSSASAHR